MESINIVMRNDLALLFTILTLGCLLGKMTVAQVQLSSAGGVLFVALFFGHFGYVLPDIINSIGFAFFIYAIGFAAGPRFFQTFRRNGLRYGIVAVVVTVMAAGTALACASLFGFSKLYLPGILAGSLTQTSTLAAAYEVSQDPALSVSYGITYPFGLFGLLLFVQFLPRIMRIDLKQEAALNDKDTGSEEEEVDAVKLTNVIRVYSVENKDYLGKSLEELNLRRKTGIQILSLKRKHSFFQAACDTVFQLHDHVLAEGSLQDHIRFERRIGPEVVDEELLKPHTKSARVVINRKQVLNRSVKELGLPQFFNVFIARLQRGPVDIGITPDLIIERGDIVTIVGPEQKTKEAIHFLGREEHKIFETDIFTFSAGLMLGIVLGRIQLPLINAPIGNAGGLLFMGIILGYLRNFGPFSGRVPVAARYILQELGLLLFLAGVGTKAGLGLLEHLFSVGPAIFISGVLVTSVTLISSIIFCYYVLRFDWNTSFGATLGGVTSTVALRIIVQQAESNYPVLGYAGVYALANILLTILGSVILFV